jgi:poly(A) polymerase Pap1
MDPIPAKKKGGVVKDLKKAGFYDAKEDKAKRLAIINKVTTKPERIEMVDKVFSAKKMSSGGTASSRADGIATKGKTRGKIC